MLPRNIPRNAHHARFLWMIDTSANWQREPVYDTPA
jgi:hypothetical protein